MVSTQLVESTNSVLRGFLQPNHSLVEFFPHFDRMLRSRREAEQNEEYKSRNSR
ncbi:hypothetical protein LINPERHAP1_LOCUS18850, partial [Linum perenne]